MDRRLTLLALLATPALSACALFGPRAGPPPDAPTESALSAARPPDVCKVTPSSLRRIGPVEAGATTFGEAVSLLGRAGDGGGDRTCWIVPGAKGVALYAHGRIADQPVRSLAIADVDEETAKGCATTQALSAPVALAAGLQLGMERPEVEKILGPVAPDEAGAFGKECCGLEQTGTGPQGPVYAFGCSAVLGAFRDGRLASLLVSRYAPPGTGEEGH